jgi:hypothetical protein
MLGMFQRPNIGYVETFYTIMMKCGSLYFQKLNLYGEVCFKETEDFKQLKFKVKKGEVGLTFLKCCQDASIFPPFTQINHHLRRPEHICIFTSVITIINPRSSKSLS